MWKNDDRMMDTLKYVIYDIKKKFPMICPVCKKKSGHMYFHRYGKRNNGGIWIWCSECKCFTHAFVRIPDWWENSEYISLEKLENYPDYLENEKELIDQWVSERILYKNT